MRVGMTYIVGQLRQYGQAAPDDEFDGVTFWTDEQLEEVADRNGTRGTVTLKRVDPDYLIYKVHAPASVRMEDAIRVFDGETELTSADFTYNPNTNELVFETALTKDSYTAYGFIIQIYDALAELWSIKADQRFNYIDWKAQNNKMNMQQEYQHCLEMARYYRNKRIRTFDKRGRGRWYE